jgi:hypothetical protein
MPAATDCLSLSTILAHASLSLVVFGAALLFVDTEGLDPGTVPDGAPATVCVDVQAASKHARNKGGKILL